jgi:hypothetical protein
MEITGKLIRILEAQKGTGARGEWSKQDFILETDDQYPKKICISNWNNKVDLSSIAIGTTVTCHVNIESREYNERWFTDIRVWKWDVLSAGAQQQESAPNMPKSDVPFPSASDIPWDKENDSEESDDLPF